MTNAVVASMQSTDTSISMSAAEPESETDSLGYTIRDDPSVELPPKREIELESIANVLMNDNTLASVVVEEVNLQEQQTFEKIGSGPTESIPVANDVLRSDEEPNETNETGDILIRDQQQGRQRTDIPPTLDQDPSITQNPREDQAPPQEDKKDGAESIIVLDPSPIREPTKENSMQKDALDNFGSLVERIREVDDQSDTGDVAAAEIDTHEETKATVAPAPEGSVPDPTSIEQTRNSEIQRRGSTTDSTEQQVQDTMETVQSTGVEPAMFLDSATIAIAIAIEDPHAPRDHDETEDKAPEDTAPSSFSISRSQDDAMEEAPPSISTLERELLKAHESAPGLKALEAVPGYENVFIEIISEVAASTNVVTDEEALRMIDEIYKMAEEAELEEEMIESISTDTLSSSVLNKILDEMRSAAEQSKLAEQQPKLKEGVEKVDQAGYLPQQLDIQMEAAPKEVPSDIHSDRSHHVEFLDEVVEYQIDPVYDDLTEVDSTSIQPSVSDQSVNRMISELRRLAEDGDAGKDSMTSASATITQNEMEQLVEEIRLAAEEAAKAPPKPKQLTKEQVQRMIGEMGAAAKGQDPETSRGLAHEDARRMIVTMRHTAETSSQSEEVAEREMQRMIDEMKWAAEQQEDEELRQEYEREVRRRSASYSRDKRRSKSRSDERRGRSNSRSNERWGRSKSRSRERRRQMERRESRRSQMQRSESRRRGEMHRRGGQRRNESRVRFESPDRSVSSSESPERYRRRSRGRDILAPVSAQEQAIQRRFGYLMNIVSSKELQEIVENERRRRAREELLELVAQSDLQGIVDRERSRRRERGDDVQRKKEKQKNRQSFPLDYYQEHRREGPTLKEKSSKFGRNPYASSSTKRKHKSRKGEEDELFSMMESQSSSLSMNSSVRHPNRYLYYVMACIGSMGLVLAVVAVVAYLNQREDSVP